MSQYFKIVVVCIFTSLFMACNTPTQKTTIKNSLVGTLWSDKEDVPTFIEFTGENTVSMWGGFYSKCDGMYTVQGNDIQFSNFRRNGYVPITYTRGTFTPNTLILDFYFFDDQTSTYELLLYKQQ